MNRFFAVTALICSLAAGQAEAQMSLPGAVAPDAGTPADQPAAAKKPHRPLDASRAGAMRAPSLAEISGQPLKLNGAEGELSLSSDGGNLRIDKFTLAGEVISNPAQKCRIDIVGASPIVAASQGEPEGLARFSADIPACELSFDVVTGAVLVPAQTTACVFQAADCQASPSGLWGPDPTLLDKGTKAVTRARAAADASIAASLRTLAERDKSADEGLNREQSDFAAQRDDVCRDYVGEARHGFCASRLTEARAAALRQRVAGLAGAAKPDVAKRHKRKPKSTDDRGDGGAKAF